MPTPAAARSRSLHVTATHLELDPFVDEIRERTWSSAHFQVGMCLKSRRFSASAIAARNE
jgi:hypothetical protein